MQPRQHHRQQESEHTTPSSPCIASSLLGPLLLLQVLLVPPVLLLLLAASPFAPGRTLAPPTTMLTHQLRRLSGLLAWRLLACPVSRMQARTYTPPPQARAAHMSRLLHTDMQSAIRSTSSGLPLQPLASSLGCPRHTHFYHAPPLPGQPAAPHPQLLGLPTVSLPPPPRLSRTPAPHS